MRNTENPLNSVIDATRKKWLLEKHKQLVTILTQIPLAETMKLSKYFSNTVNYNSFMKYWHSIEIADGLFFEARQSNLLELAELGIKLLQNTISSLEEIYRETPDNTVSDLGEEKLENLYELVIQFKSSSQKCKTIFTSFINQQGNNASILFPIYRKVCADFTEYLNQLRILLIDILNNLKKLNPSFDGDETYQQMVAALSFASAKVLDTSESSCSTAEPTSFDESEISIDGTLLERGNELQHVLLQRFQLENESHVPTLNVALQRAAISGSVHDINDLLHFGADINSQSDKSGQTALHMAIMHGKEINAQCLIAKRANTKLKDAKGDTPLVLSQRMHFSAITKLLSSQAHPVFRTRDPLMLFLKFLSASDLFRLQRVNSQWQNAAIKVMYLHLEGAGLHEEHIRLYQGLPKYLQYTILKYAMENHALNRLNELFTMLQVNTNSREALLEPIVYPRQMHPVHAKNLTLVKISDVGLVLHFTNLLPLNQHFQMHNSDSLYSEYGCLILADGLLTINQIARFVHSSSAGGTHSNLNELICKNGYFALKLKLLSADDAPCISGLKVLLTDIGLSTLKEGLITSAQARQFYHSGSANGPFDNLGKLLSEEGIIFLREGYISLEQAVYLSRLEYLLTKNVIVLFKRGFICLKDFPSQKITEVVALTSQLYLLSTEIGLSMFEKGLINQKNLITIKNIKSLIHPNGIEALSTGLITLEQASKIQDLDALLSDEGIKALKIGALTVEQAIEHESLALLKIKNGIKALKEGLITLEQAEKLLRHGVTHSFHALLSDEGLELLREGVLTMEQAATFCHSNASSGLYDNLRDLLTPLGKQALREKLIDPSKASQANLRTMFSHGRTPKILIALKLGLVTLDDFKYKGRFENDRDLDIKIEELLQPRETFNFDKDKANVVISMQSFFRSKHAQRKLQLLKRVKCHMQAGRLDQLDQLKQARDLIFNNKSHEAKQILDQIDTNRVRPGNPKSLHNILARSMEPLLIQMGEVCEMAMHSFKSRDYSRTMWELCQIEHPNAEQLYNMLLKHCKRLGLELNKAHGKKQEAVLHILAKKGLFDSYNLFVAFGADESLKDADGVTPSEYLSLHLLFSQGATLTLNK